VADAASVGIKAQVEKSKLTSRTASWQLAPRQASATINRMSKRVLLAGLFHETHTFLDGTTSLADFSVRSGSELLDARGDGSPLAGALETAAACGWRLLPAADLRATPSATVEDDVFETFWNRVAATLERGRREPAGLDGIFLVLHGAMVCRSIRDVEGELVARLRAVPGGERIPLCGVLDLHGNLSRSTIESSDGVVAYRSNPHVDAQQAAVDAARLLDRILTTGRRPRVLYEQAPLMWPPTGTGTADPPMRTLEQMAREAEQADHDIAAVNVMAGFSFADTADTGVSFSAITFGDPAVAREALARLRTCAVERRAEGNLVEPPLESVMPQVLAAVAAGLTPLAIVEPADNIGGGAPGDGTSVLRALLQHRVVGGAVIINDPATVATLADAPLGAKQRVTVGGRSRFSEPPLEIEATLVSRSDGRFELADRHSHLASMSGVSIDMGPCAVLRCDGVTVLVTTRKTPPFDLAQLTSQGIEPEKLTAIGVKAAVAHRRAYDPIVKASFTVSTPGPCSSDLRSLPFVHVRRPVYPLDSW
jgi:microcystin degradation protein MlrC